MLDQNTDRMWYVIGAVLIGAAIIFGMNTLMPNAFASVSDSFSLFNDKAMEVVSEIEPNVRVREYKLVNGSFDDGWNGWNINSISKLVDVDGRSAVHIQPDFINASRIGGGGIWQGNILKENGSVRVTFDAKGISDNAKAYMGFLNIPQGARGVEFTNTWRTYSFEVKDIDISENRFNRFHIYANSTEFYIDNIRIEVLD